MTGAPLAPGQILADKYRIEETLGTGGMGVVVAATHLQLHVRVAIKFLRPEAGADAAATSRLFREARATAQIKSDHVARVIDIGVLEAGGPYIVMELLEGADLATHLRGAGPLPIADAIAYVLEACEGVHQAHTLGIVHRDLKPSNLFLVRDADGRRRVKVLDFGLSKVTGGLWARSVAERLTAAHAMVGSPLYMSPEQLGDAGDVDARTDIWSLGAILFELLGGRPPFEAKTLPQLCTLVMHSRPRALSELRPDLPPGLAAVVARCLEKNPSRRYATVRELAAALARLASSGRPSWLEMTEGPAVAAPRADRRRRARRAVVVAAVLAAVAALGVQVRRRAGRDAASLAGTVQLRHGDNDTAARGGPAKASCATCISASCAGEYRACTVDHACNDALQTYNRCVGRDAGAGTDECSEAFGTDSNPAAERLATCVFVKTGGPVVLPGKCTDVCNGALLEDEACAGYCGCMRQTCQATLDPADCPRLCAALTPEQLRCRTFHCFLASKGQPEVHCQHSVGRFGMCP